MTDPSLALAKELIARPSVTPDDAGCLDIIGDRLAALDFHIERLRFGEVDNLWARLGDEQPLLVFAGHTDVVPPGPLDQWHSNPFEPTIRDGVLYGRGAADMKSSLAAMITAAEEWLRGSAKRKGSLGFLFTSDEEGPARDGTVKVVERLQARGETIDYCLVGEPSSSKQLGDVIKNGRRGSLSANLLVSGKQGHVAYPEQVRNPIHLACAIIAKLTATQWDNGNAFFPPTSFQVSNVNAGTGAENVVPETASIACNFRFSTESSAESLQQRFEEIVLKESAKCGEGFDYTIKWRLSGQPFLTDAGSLVAATQQAISEQLGVAAVLSTSGGTSDGRFIAPTGAQVLEFGPRNATIHQLNERVAVEELPQLRRCYRRIMELLLESDA